MLDHCVHVGNPADGPLLVPAIKRIAKRFGLVPAAVTCDRGYGDTQVEADLTELGVRWSRSPARASRVRPAATSNSSPGSTASSSGAPAAKAGSAASPALSRARPML